MAAGSKSDESPVPSHAGIGTLLHLGRINFLIYSPIAFAAGVACATWNTSAPNFSVSLYFIGQFYVSGIHMLTHFFNEYYDLAADSLHQFPSPWSGGSRVLVDGKIRPETSLRLGLALTLCMVLYLTTFIPKSETKLVGAVGLVFAIGYSTPPLQLGRRGLGEATVTLELNVLLPLFGYSLFRSPESSSVVLLALVPAALVEFARMMVMNMADVVSDARASKLTLVVRLGLDDSTRIHALIMGAAYLTLAALFLMNYVQWKVFLLELLTLPLGAVICWRLLHRREYLHVVKFYDIPFHSTQHNALILLAALVGLMWSDMEHGFFSPMVQTQLLGVWLLLGVFGAKAWRGWQRGELGQVFSPQLGVHERVAKKVQIEEWERGIAQSAQPFRYYGKTL